MTIAFIILVILNVMFLWHRLTVNHYYNKLCSSDNAISFFSNYKWLGFRHSFNQLSTINWAEKIGLISKLEGHRIFMQSSTEVGLSNIIKLKGCWFRNVEEIGFRFTPLDRRLIEIRLVYNCSLYPYQLSPEQQYEKMVSYISKSRGGVKEWDDIGISLEEITKSENVIKVILFLTKPKSSVFGFKNNKDDSCPPKLRKCVRRAANKF